MQLNTVACRVALLIEIESGICVVALKYMSVASLEMSKIRV